MKYGKLRTLRGQIEVTGGGVGKKSLIAADGLINYGLQIEEFQVWAVDPSNSFISILSYDKTITGTQMNAGDNRQFGWTVGNGTGDLNPTYLDPDHIINRDMFLSLVSSDNGIYNYLIQMRVVELSDDEAIVTIIKETSQS
tara:strand:+ start:872 stop:1294 length:423 start_codon:yes stop_codon:yes gene_type:complete